MKPFRDYYLGDYIAQRGTKIQLKIESLTNDEIMSNSLDILANNIFEEFYIVPINLAQEDVSKRSVIQKKITRYIDPIFRDFSGRESVEVDGVCASFYYPYTGEKDLFKCQASTFTTGGYPDIRIENDYVVLDIERTLKEMQGKDAKQHFQSILETKLNDIKRGISFVNTDVNSFNARLKNEITNALVEKKNKVSAFYSIAEMIEVPIEKKEYAKTHISVDRRNIVPITHKYPTESTYAIKDSDYDDILSSIKHTATTYERTPASYKFMQEEDLRNTLLAALNGIYEGSATGETFRNKGKTDICIEMKNRAAFVAECKIWTGSKCVNNAIWQLDDYLTWRDCKTALILFVRKKDFFSILDKTHEALKLIPSIKAIEEIDKNEFKCQYASESTPGQIVQLRVMLFNLFFEES